MEKEKEKTKDSFWWFKGTCVPWRHGRFLRETRQGESQHFSVRISLIVQRWQENKPTPFTLFINLNHQGAHEKLDGIIQQQDE